MARKPRYTVSVDGSEYEAARRLKEDTVAHYGGKCFECGEDDLDVLEVRPFRKNGPLGTLYWLRARGYPKEMDGREVTITCGNCNVRRKKV